MTTVKIIATDAAASAVIPIKSSAQMTARTIDTAIPEMINMGNLLSLNLTLAVDSST